MSKAAKVRKVLAVASGGGHWAQLMRVVSAFHDQELVFATVDAEYAADHPAARVHVVPDANRWDKLGLFRLAWAMARVVLRERPDIVFSTGAAPGLFAIVFGRLLGARTIWLDSIANVERVSVSGRLAGPFSQLWLTQWPDLSRAGGPEFAGRVF